MLLLAYSNVQPHTKNLTSGRGGKTEQAALAHFHKIKDALLVLFQQSLAQNFKSIKA